MKTKIINNMNETKTKNSFISLKTIFKKNHKN